jgi:phosphohistidine phosphatase
MKRIIIVRHAKAVPYGYEDDFNRDLQERGKNDAKRVSLECKKWGVVPDIMISSPAKRALKTARIFAETLDYEKNQIAINEDIYEGMTTGEFIDLIRSLPENAGTAFFFGHNPGFFYYVTHLLKHYHEELPTCATIGIDFSVEKWEQVSARNGDMSLRITPKMLK